MKSKIAEYIKLKNQPVAVIRSDTLPEGALQFKEGTKGCIVSMLSAASKGRTAALSDATVVCPGGKVGSGFHSFEPGVIEYFLSVGGKGPKPGEFYKETPALALDFIQAMPKIESKEFLVLKPLNEVEEGEEISTIVFLANADQLAGLVTLANYDQGAESSVAVRFGPGCSQSLLYSIADADAGRGTCTLGLTDPSARMHVDKDVLSFSMPFARFLEMESKAEGSFLTKDTWNTITGRL